MATQGYGKYSIKKNIINVSPNVNFTQSILPYLPQDEATISLLLKRQMEYKSPNLIGSVCPNLIMTTLHDHLSTHHLIVKYIRKLPCNINGKWPSSRPWYIEFINIIYFNV